jgi:hypothetical protein
MRTVAVGSNILKPFTHALALGILRVPTEGSCKRLFLLLVAIRGHNPALENVGSTDSDKRTEPCLYLLRKLGVVKTGRVPDSKLDKRENRPQWITLWITTRHLLCRVS